MKALEILKESKLFIEQQLSEFTKDTISYDYKILNEAIKELELLDNDLKDLFSCIELTEDESYEKRFTSIEAYLIRLSKFIK